MPASDLTVTSSSPKCISDLLCNSLRPSKQYSDDFDCSLKAYDKDNPFDLSSSRPPSPLSSLSSSSPHSFLSSPSSCSSPCRSANLPTYSPILFDYNDPLQVYEFNEPSVDAGATSVLNAPMDILASADGKYKCLTLLEF